jgi:hypothetical protein
MGEFTRYVPVIDTEGKTIVVAEFTSQIPLEQLEFRIAEPWQTLSGDGALNDGTLNDGE